MDIQPKRYIANELKMHAPLLKQITNHRKKQVWVNGDKLNTLIIDYGSQNIKAGYDWSTEGPDLIFRPQISKNRDINRADLPIKVYINTSYDQLDLSKINYKSPYQRNLILHFSLMEQCNDYIFGQIYRPNKKIRSPLIITQPFANPQHCRGSMLQQFFECYQIDSVMIGVDCLFAYFYEVGCSMSRYQSQTALIINMGASTIHIAAMISGKVDYNSIRRINIGGNNSFELFGKSLLLKNPQLKDKFTYSFLRDIYQKFTSVAIDYRQQLLHFQRHFKQQPNNNIYHNRIQELNKQIDEGLRFVQGIEIDFDIIIEIPQEQIKRKEQVRKRMSEKLKQTLNRRKQMKFKLHEMQLKNLMDLKQRYQAHDKFAHQQVVEIFGQHKSHEKLQKKIKALEIKLGLIEEKTEQGKFNLINIPDHELPPQKIKYKKLQIYQKQALEHRRQKQLERQLQENRMKQLRQNNPQIYLTQLKQKYKAQYARIKESQRIKSELNNRKSKLKQRKMQVIARISQQDFDPDQQQGQDDWLAYKDLQESDHYSEIQAMQAQLRQIDPQWTQAKDHHHLKQTNQLFLFTDLLKCHEIYFQPLMINNNQIDLIQTIISMLSAYNSQVIKKLLKNIVVVGGGSVIQGLKERLTRDLIRQGPSDAEINVKIGKGGPKGAFLGMQYIGKHQRQFLQKMSYKRQEYLSKNGNMFVKNPWSNPQPNK